eukprot:m51a1_g3387 hypothetical protein (516) ;mRNA; r:505298-508846
MRLATVLALIVAANAGFLLYAVTETRPAALPLVSAGARVPLSPQQQPASADDAEARLAHARGELQAFQRAFSVALDEARVAAEREAERRVADERAAVAKCRGQLADAEARARRATKDPETQLLAGPPAQRAPQTPDPAQPQGLPVCVNGYLVVNRCFCDRGWTGAACDKAIPNLRKCNHISCFVTPDAGVSHVPHFMWTRAQESERKFWNGSKWTNDRAREHAEGFGHYSVLPEDLGRLLEVGAGPFTQTRFILATRRDLKPSSVTLLDPSLYFYMRWTPNCAYKTGALGKHPTVLVNAMAEDFEFTRAKCDERTEPRHRCTHVPGCWFTEDSGTANIPRSMWQTAQEAKREYWVTSLLTNDRARDHKEKFQNYELLPDDLGKVLEIGPGPFTQIKWILGARDEFDVHSITLVDPNLLFYMGKTQNCAYKSGDVSMRQTILMMSAAEDLHMRDEFDTLVMVDVLEHVSNAHVVLQNAFEALKVGGFIVLQERYLNGKPQWKDKGHPVAISETLLR